MVDIAADWEGGIEEFVNEANRRLVGVLPAERASRPKDEVNARLVRHYTTEGLLPLPRREGREARYGRLHLLSLLALRRLMADGLSGKSLTSALSGRSEAELAHLAQEGNLGLEGRLFSPVVASVSTSPLAYVQHLMAESSAAPGFAGKMMARAMRLPSSPEPSSALSPRRKIVSRQVTRVQVVRGLMLEIDETFRPPRDERERQALLDALWASLVDAEQAGF